MPFTQAVQTSLALLVRQRRRNSTRLVSRPIKTLGVDDDELIPCSSAMSISWAHRSRLFEAFASLVASLSHEASNISPRGSMSLTPLSPCGLCEAVIISPTVADFKYTERRATNMPIRCMTWSRCSALKPDSIGFGCRCKTTTSTAHSLATNTRRAVLKDFGSRVRVRLDVRFSFDNVFDPLVHLRLEIKTCVENNRENYLKYHGRWTTRLVSCA